MSLKNIRFVPVVFLTVLLCLSLTAQAEMGTGTVQDPVTGKLTNGVQQNWNQGIVLDPQTGNYIITYKDAYGFFNSSVFEPATKITPHLATRFGMTNQDGLIEYRYTLSNARTSKQGIKGFRVLVSSIAPGNSLKAGNWEGMVAPTVTDSNFYLSWFCSQGDNACSLLPGRRQEGLRVTSRDLPGISVAEIRGKTTFISGLVAERDVSPALAQQINDLTSFKDFVPRAIAVPLIKVPMPFDAAVVINGIQSHIDSDLINMKLIDPAFAAQLDRLLLAASDAAKLNNRVAVLGDIKDLRKLLREQQKDLNKDDNEDFDQEHGDKDRDEADQAKPAPIDRLAAQVLSFDLQYVANRLKEQGDKDQR